VKQGHVVVGIVLHNELHDRTGSDVVSCVGDWIHPSQKFLAVQTP